jgi:hypothetical protein
MKRRASSPPPRPTFRVDIRTANRAPHVITFTPVTPGTETDDSLESLVEILLEKIKSAVVDASTRYTNWTEEYINNHVQGIISAVNLEGGGNSSIDDVVRLNDLKPEDLLLMLEKIHESNATVGFFDIEWQFWITPQSLIRGGSQNITKPKWHTASAYSQTWKGYSDTIGPISCAAFSIVWSLYSIYNN